MTLSAELLLCYPAIYIPSKTGYGAFSPQVPGCIAAGSTLDEARTLMTDALQEHIQSMIDDGDALPATSPVTESVEAGDVLEWAHIRVSWRDCWPREEEQGDIDIHVDPAEFDQAVPWEIVKAENDI